ncbi:MULTISPECIES: hypothetical protein [Actinobacillus]|uniref:Uncharacterized protein n=1 Tax=Actinobacillus lignieresii TaxID=720 RepID=A0A380TVI0_ACTLI|nr:MULTISPECIES: hypothetical protein [Actinobacillus]UKH19984.1 hypothetical protein D1109_01925 [Actinobacillus pleuropneumoniae]UPA21797.1 hypothetical protein JS559_04900 [Actinobacillus pleuropneumoniae]WGE51333.1 hypothetical protein NYR68_02785 [Actinobacillus equuli subsp. haemolyticus]SUT92693.1 Uncharacterised protein [Actinobacillus lignieresii]
MRISVSRQFKLDNGVELEFFADGDTGDQATKDFMKLCKMLAPPPFYSFDYGERPHGKRKKTKRKQQKQARRKNRKHQ